MCPAGKWNVECVIYDCDGVLFDSFDANRRLYTSIAASAGIETLTEDELRYCNTHTVFQSIAHICRNLPGSEEAALQYFRTSIDFRDFIVYLTMEPHVIETLQRLKEMGIARAISTNRTTSMKHIMERYGLWPYFDIVVTAAHEPKPGDAGPMDGRIIQARSKPDPEGVGKILNALAVKEESSIYIGDSEIDMGTARASGVRFVAYKNSGLEADGVIFDHLALLEFLSNA